MYAKMCRDCADTDGSKYSKSKYMMCQEAQTILSNVHARLRAYLQWRELCLCNSTSKGNVVGRPSSTAHLRTILITLLGGESVC